MRARRAALAAALSAALLATCGAPAVRPEPPVDPVGDHRTEPPETPRTPAPGD